MSKTWGQIGSKKIAITNPKVAIRRKKNTSPSQERRITRSTPVDQPAAKMAARRVPISTAGGVPCCAGSQLRKRCKLDKAMAISPTRIVQYDGRKDHLFNLFDACKALHLETFRFTEIIHARGRAAVETPCQRHGDIVCLFVGCEGEIGQRLFVEREGCDDAQRTWAFAQKSRFRRRKKGITKTFPEWNRLPSGSCDVTVMTSFWLRAASG
jgi:hypothetical protein